MYRTECSFFMLLNSKNRFKVETNNKKYKMKMEIFCSFTNFICTDIFEILMILNFSWDSLHKIL